MRLAVFVLSLALLLAGCASTGESGPVQPAGEAPADQSAVEPSQEIPEEPQAPADSCEAYCAAQPHPDCTGHWSVSGIDLACLCDYVCDAVPAEDPGPEVPSAEPSVGLVPSTTDQDVLVMLKSALESQKSDFYSQHSGTFKETTYTWLRWFPPGGENVVEISPATQILFDGDAISSIQAMGFIVFEKDDESRTAYGAGIFDGTTILGDLSTFDIDYLPEGMEFRDCDVYDTEQSAGSSLVTYHLRCEEVD